MQSAGGYRYPGTVVLLVLSVAALIVSLATSWKFGLSPLATFRFWCELQGVATAASAFTPVGLVPPPHGVFRKVRWFLSPQYGTSVQFNQPLFYLGVVLVLAGIVLGTIESSGPLSPRCLPQ